MIEGSWDAGGQAHQVMEGLVRDYGPQLLSNVQLLRNLLGDKLPTLPREASILVAAAEARVAETLRDRLGQHIPAEVAVRQTSLAFQEQRGYDSTASSWAVTEFARALGYTVTDPVEPTVAAIDTAGSREAGTVVEAPAVPTPQPTVRPAGTTLLMQRIRVPILAAAVVVVLAGIGFYVISRTGAKQGATGQSGSSSAPTSSPKSNPPTPLASAQSLSWRQPKLSQAAVSPVLLTEWRNAPNRTVCPAIYPSDIGAGSGATARRASFSGGWAIAWDRPGSAGTYASGYYCKNCGRGAFGIAGNLDAASGNGDNSPPTTTWPDGSRANISGESGIGPEADAAHPDQTVGVPGEFATLVIAEDNCMYQLWSYLPGKHLEYLINHLRFVEGAP